MTATATQPMRNRLVCALPIVIAVFMLACTEKESFDSEALELARQACIKIDSAVDAVTDNAATATSALREAIALGDQAADRDLAFAGIAVSASAIHDAIVDRDPSAMARYYAGARHLCEPILDGKRPETPGE